MKEIESLDNTTVPGASKSMDYEGYVPIMSVTFGIAPENGIQAGYVNMQRY